jgi:photosystem II stability/assembly factor-like uncharacterized protein
MNSRRTLNTLLLVTGIVFLAGAGIVAPNFYPGRRATVRLDAEPHSAAAQQRSKSSVSDSSNATAVQTNRDRWLTEQEKSAGASERARRAATTPQRPAQTSEVTIAEGAATRTEAPLSLERGPKLAEQGQGYRESEDEDEDNGPTNPDGAFRFRRLQLQDEKGEIPPDGLEKARQHVELMKAEQQKRIKVRPKVGEQPGIPEIGIAPDSWTWLGPGNVGGRIRSIVIQPANPNNMWVGSVGGGIWRTTNAGASWFPVNDFQANLAVSTMVINPVNTSVMYAGTGEGFGNADAIQGAGIFKSTDSGVTWNSLASTVNVNFFFVNRLAISTDGSTLLAATSPACCDSIGNTVPGGIWRSTDGGTSWARSTCPNGINPNAPCASAATDINFRPGDSSKAVVGELGAARFSFDGGRTWTAATFNPPIANGGTQATNGRVETASVLSSPAIVYASVNQNNGDVYRSNDGGQSYIRVNTGTNFFGAKGNGWYHNSIWLNPQDADTVIVGGVDLWRGRYTSPNLPLTQISRWQAAPGSSAHADHHIIVAHPGFNNTTNRIVYFGNDGGIYRADDAATVVETSGWTNLNHNLGITQFYGAAGSAMSGNIIGGAQDNGTLTFNGNAQGWNAMSGGDGGYCASDPTDASYFYGEIQNLGIVRSMNGGANAGDISFGIGDANRNPAQANFIAPFVLDPTDPNIMLAGGWSLWRSNDVKSFIPAPTWSIIKSPNAGSIPISAIAVSPSTSNFILVGHNNGDIFLTFNGTDGLPTWQQIDTPNLPNRIVTRLTIDNTRNPTWIYATFGGFAGDDVYRTTNLGATWVDVTGVGATGLPNVPVFSLVFHPSNPNVLYVGTEIGIFTSDDAGANWAPVQNGPANVSVQELFWMGGDLIAATHGRGLYRASGGVYVDCNYNGIQLGTFDLPFKTITAAVDASPTFRTIWIKPCTYFEPAIINRRVELRSLGGTAIIRRP